MNKKPKVLKGGYFYIVLIVALCIFSFLNGANPLFSKKIDLSTVIKHIESGEVDRVDLVGNELKITLKAKNKDGVKEEIANTVPTLWGNGELMNMLTTNSEKYGFDFNYQEPINFGAWLNAGLIILMAGVTGVIFMTYIKKGGKGGNPMNFGKSRAKLYQPSKISITFDNVAGADEEKKELQEVIDFLKNPKRYHDLGARIPRGILLVGPPGTGKTLLAKAVAGEASVPFFSISGSDFVEMFVGVGASRVRALFEEAKKRAPGIIFIDEIDAVGRQRGAGLGGGHDEREQTLNQLLVEMDGFGPNEDAIVIAATNRPDILDPALLRPGRFDRRVLVSAPDMKGRAEILQVHSKGKPIDPSIDLKEIAQITPGFTGADLANVLNEAALFCARRNDTKIIYEDIQEAIFKMMVGTEKKSRIMTKNEKESTAYHEAGHALILRTVSETNRVERVSIIPAGQAGGYTAHKPYQDFYYSTKEMLIASMMVSLGGRAAEDIIYGKVSTGASNDLVQCNSIARDLIVKYGMSDRLPNMVFGNESGEVFLGRDYGHAKNYSEEVAHIIDEEVRSLIADCYDKVVAILRNKKDVLHALAKVLVEKEKIDGDEFELIYQENTTEILRANDASNIAVEEVTTRVLKSKNDIEPIIDVPIEE